MEIKIENISFWYMSKEESIRRFFATITAG